MPVERSAPSAPPRPAPPAPGAWNVPNVLTVLRLALVPLFGVLLLADDGQSAALRIWAAAVFVVAILTDRFDGSIARRHNLVTDVGTLLDPIADKALTGMAFIGLSLIGELWWAVTAVVLFREAFVTGLRMWVIRHGVIPASKGGKVKTTLQALAISGLVLPFRQLDGNLQWLGEVLWWAAVVVMAAAVVVTVVTGVDYVSRALRLRQTQVSGPSGPATPPS